MKLKFEFLILILISIFYINSTSCQNIVGIVRDMNGEGIDYANVVIYDTTGKVVNYQLTDSGGKFSLDTKKQAIKFIEVSALGYKIIRKEVQDIKNYMTFVLEEEIFELREIEVKAKILRDTVNVAINKNLTTNATLKDILNQSNEVEISDNGTIYHEGKPINKILINKKEVFINQNNIALDNVTNEMIEKMQIINNYKDKFDLDYNKSSVINIDTKESFKGVSKNDIYASFGHKNTFVLKIRSLYFSDKFNLFFTSNTNNILKRDFKFENNNLSVISNSSLFYKNIVSSFISENRNVSKSFLSSSGLTLRRENQQSRLSIIIYQNILNSLFNTEIERINNLIRINTQSFSNSSKGNLNLGNLNYNMILNKKNILSYDLNVGYSQYKQNSSILNINYNGNEFEEQNVNNTNNLNLFNLNNNFSVKRKINEKVILNSEFNFYNELSGNYLNAEVLDRSFENLDQQIKFNSSKFLGNISVNYIMNQLISTNIGLESIYNSEKLNSEPFLKNQETRFAIPLTIRGNKEGNFSFFLKVNGSYWNNLIDDEQEERLFLPISSAIFYRINSKSNVNFYFDRLFVKPDFLSTLPIFFKDYSTVLISNPTLNNQLVTKNNLGIRYVNEKFSKSRFFSISSDYILNQNIPNDIFDRVEDNILFFKFLLFNQQETLYNNFRYSKGWYLPKTLHKIILSSKFEYILSNNSLLEENLIYQNNSFNQNYVISFEPNKLLLKRIDFKYNNTISTFYGNNILLNKFIIERYQINCSAENKFIELRIQSYYELFKISDKNFKRKDMDIDFRYKLKEVLSITLNASSLLTLFGIDNNVNNISTNNNQGLVTQIINPNILGYLLIGINFKI